MNLNELKPNPKRVRASKRIGRGTGSGFGKTCGKGHKGMKSRSGGTVRIGFEGGQMPLQKRTPKFGFSSRVNRFKEEVNLSSLIKLEKDLINLSVLASAGLVKKSTKKVKVIKDAEECLKMDLKGINVTSSVRSIIEKSGGSVEV